MTQTFYDHLGVDPKADREGIEAAFRTACAISGGSGNVPQSARLAHLVLSSPEKRQAYNELLHAAATAEVVPAALAHMYKLASDEWGFAHHDQEEGTVFRFDGVPVSHQDPLPAPKAAEDPPPPLRLTDVVPEATQPKKHEWRPEPLVLGSRILSLRPFEYTITDAIYTADTVQLHLAGTESQVFEFPELVTHRGLRPGTSVLFTGAAERRNSEFHTFVTMSAFPYESAPGPMAFRLESLLNRWDREACDYAGRNGRGRSPSWRDRCNVYFGRNASSQREYHQLLYEYLCGTLRAMYYFNRDFWDVPQSDREIERAAHEGSLFTLGQWGLKRTKVTPRWL